MPQSHCRAPGSSAAWCLTLQLPSKTLLPLCLLQAMWLFGVPLPTRYPAAEGLEQLGWEEDPAWCHCAVTSLPFLGLGLGVSSAAAHCCSCQPHGTGCLVHGQCLCHRLPGVAGSHSPERHLAWEQIPEEWGSHGEQGTRLPA